MITLPAGIVPVKVQTTRSVLYGERNTTYRYEILSHNPTTGIDSLVGYLDGVEPSGSLEWSSYGTVKKSGDLVVRDIETAQSGKLRIRDVPLTSARIRPVLVIEGLPEIPLGVYLFTAAPEQWDDTGRTLSLDLHEKSTVLDQDVFDESFTADTSTPVLEIIADVIASAGERISVDGSDLRTLPNPLVWDSDEDTKLKIVNDLLEAIGYNSLWMDGQGNFRATPYIRPAQRPVRYAMLTDDGEALPRELVDGEESIYLPNFARDRDNFRVPNRVRAVQAGTGDAEPLVGVASNEDPSSEFSFAARGRWIVQTIRDVEVPDFSAEADPEAATIAFLEDRAEKFLIAASAVQAAVSVTALPIPVELLEAVRFRNDVAGIDALHVIRRVGLQLRSDGLMTLDLQEVIDLESA